MRPPTVSSLNGRIDFGPFRHPHATPSIIDGNIPVKQACEAIGGSRTARRIGERESFLNPHRGVALGSCAGRLLVRHVIAAVIAAVFAAGLRTTIPKPM